MQKGMLCIIFFVLVLSGCNSQKYPKNESNALRNVSDHTGNSHTPLVEEKNDEVHQSKDIVDLTETVPGVKNAYVLVSGTYTVVGIESQQPVEKGSENEALRKSVYDVIKTNAHGRNAVITTDPTKVKKIKELGKNIRSSEYTVKSGIYSELTDLISHIGPVKGQKKSTRRQDMHEYKNKNYNDMYE